MCCRRIWWAVNSYPHLEEEKTKGWCLLRLHRLLIKATTTSERRRRRRETSFVSSLTWIPRQHETQSIRLASDAVTLNERKSKASENCLRPMAFEAFKDTLIAGCGFRVDSETWEDGRHWERLDLIDILLIKRGSNLQSTVHSSVSQKRRWIPQKFFVLLRNSTSHQCVQTFSLLFLVITAINKPRRTVSQIIAALSDKSAISRAISAHFSFMSVENEISACQNQIKAFN